MKGNYSHSQRNPQGKVRKKRKKKHLRSIFNLLINIFLRRRRRSREGVGCLCVVMVPSFHHNLYFPLPPIPPFSLSSPLPSQSHHHHHHLLIFFSLISNPWKPHHYFSLYPMLDSLSEAKWPVCKNNHEKKGTGPRLFLCSINFFHHLRPVRFLGRLRIRKRFDLWRWVGEAPPRRRSSPVRGRFFSKSRDTGAWEKDHGAGSPPRSETLWRRPGCGLEHSTPPKRRRVRTTPQPETSEDQRRRLISPSRRPFTTISTLTPAIRFPITGSTPAPEMGFTSTGDPPPAAWAAPSSPLAVPALPVLRHCRRSSPGGDTPGRRRLFLRTAAATATPRRRWSITATATTWPRRRCCLFDASRCRSISTRRRWTMLKLRAGAVMIFTAPFSASDETMSMYWFVEEEIMIFLFYHHHLNFFALSFFPLFFYYAEKNEDGKRKLWLMISYEIMVIWS